LLLRRSSKFLNKHVGMIPMLGGAGKRRCVLPKRISKIFCLGRFLSDPARYDWLKNERFIMTNQSQLELGFDASCGWQPARHQPRRLTRAQWWFAQMRQIVDRALDWQPTPPPRPEQTWFTQTRRQASV
jgi:hypothetical protein